MTVVVLHRYSLGLLTAMAFAFIAASSFAQDKHANCGKDVNQMTLNICSYQRFQADDLTLNKMYQAMMTQLDEVEKKYAIAAQAAWIKFRDAECVALSGGPREQGGTICASSEQRVHVKAHEGSDGGIEKAGSVPSRASRLPRLIASMLTNVHHRDLTKPFA